MAKIIMALIGIALFEYVFGIFYHGFADLYDLVKDLFHLIPLKYGLRKKT